MTSNSSSARFLVSLFRRALVLGFLLLLCPMSVSAARISLNIELRRETGFIALKLSNRGEVAASGVCVSLESDTLRQGSCFEASLLRGQSVTFRVQEPARSDSGSYVWIGRASYLNAGTRIGVVHAQTFSTERDSSLSFPCHLGSAEFRYSSSVSVGKMRGDPEVSTRLIVPEHIVVERTAETSEAIKFSLRSTTQGLNSDGAAFAAYEKATDGVRYAKVCATKIQTYRNVQRESFYPSRLLLALGLLFFMFSLVLYATGTRSTTSIAGIRWSFSLSICSFVYLGFRHSGIFADVLLAWLQEGFVSGFYPGTVVWVLGTLVRRLYFIGNDFEPFFRRASDLLYSYMLFGNYFVLRYLIRPAPQADKYWHLLEWIFRARVFQPLVAFAAPLFGRGAGTSASSNMSLARIAMLSYVVKAFYLPLLWSWTFSNIAHLQNLSHTESWSYVLVTKAMIDVLIFLDVAVFAVGYAVELPQCRNTIRTVDPSVLGWLVCLLCYPPFNQVFFPIFDFAVFDTWPVWSEMTKNIVRGIVVLLWLIYTWASLALGMKASNLTNRGIVATGPYRFVRHPAYASKVAIWILSVIYLAEGYGLNIAVAMVVYTLRALTEERHLRADAGYVAYQANVRWRFLPGVI